MMWMMAEKNSLNQYAGKRGWSVPILLTVSLALNILALTLPFLEIDEAFKEPIPYKLIHSVRLMWDDKLYVIAGLILGFSIIFPFAKLISLYLAWFLKWRSSTRVKFLHIIELMGKWSFMDIFVVILLIALTHDQQWISSTIKIGVYFFIGAISLSMFVSEAIIRIAKDEVGEENLLPDKNKKILLITDHFKISWTIPVLAIISGYALVRSFHSDFLQIHQAFLVSYSFSIYSLGVILSQMKLWILFCVLVSTIAVFPAARLLILLISWVSPMKICTHYKMRAIIDSLSRWCMLDVFGLALFLIATEGKELVKTELKSGLYIVIIAIGLSYLLGAMAVLISKVLTSLPCGTKS